MKSLKNMLYESMQIVESVSDEDLSTILAAIQSEMKWNILSAKVIDLKTHHFIGTEFPESTKNYGSKNGILYEGQPGQSLIKDLSKVIESYLDKRQFKIMRGSDNSRSAEQHYYLILFK